MVTQFQLCIFITQSKRLRWEYKYDTCCAARVVFICTFDSWKTCQHRQNSADVRCFGIAYHLESLLCSRISAKKTSRCLVEGLLTAQSCLCCKNRLDVEKCERKMKTGFVLFSYDVKRSRDRM